MMVIREITSSQQNIIFVHERVEDAAFDVEGKNMYLNDTGSGATNKKRLKS
jgi:hypothetical protein